MVPVRLTSTTMRKTSGSVLGIPTDNAGAINQDVEPGGPGDKSFELIALQKVKVLDPDAGLRGRRGRQAGGHDVSSEVVEVTCDGCPHTAGPADDERGVPGEIAK